MPYRSFTVKGGVTRYPKMLNGYQRDPVTYRAGAAAISIGLSPLIFLYKTVVLLILNELHLRTN